MADCGNMRAAVSAESLAAVMEAIGSDRLSGYEVMVRLAKPPAAPDPPEPALYPTLHRLEADGRLRAGWSTDPSGQTRRLYRKS
jgi:DNA-binding PadR family transcriptional regulator